MRDGVALQVGSKKPELLRYRVSAAATNFWRDEKREALGLPENMHA